MKKTNIFLIMVMILFFLSNTSCDKKEDDEPIETEYNIIMPDLRGFEILEDNKVVQRVFFERDKEGKVIEVQDWRYEEYWGGGMNEKEGTTTVSYGDDNVSLYNTNKRRQIDVDLNKQGYAEKIYSNNKIAYKLTYSGDGYIYQVIDASRSDENDDYYRLTIQYKENMLTILEYGDRYDIGLSKEPNANKTFHMGLLGKDIPTLPYSLEEDAPILKDDKGRITSIAYGATFDRMVNNYNLGRYSKVGLGFSSFKEMINSLEPQRNYACKNIVYNTIKLYYK